MYFAIWTFIFGNLDNNILQFGQYHFAMGQSHLPIRIITFGNLDKFIWQLGQIHLVIGTFTFCNLGKYLWQLGKLHLSIWTNTFDNLDENIWQLGQIDLTTCTNTFGNGNFDNYVLQFLGREQLFATSRNNSTWSSLWRHLLLLLPKAN